jgi:hypothetical protein
MRGFASRFGIHTLIALLVRAEGLEPPRLAPLVPKTSVSTNFTTPACTKRDAVGGSIAKAAHASRKIRMGRYSIAFDGKDDEE